MKVQSTVFIVILPLLELNLNFHKWLRQNFSLQYLYNINQISDENKEKYQFGDNKLIQY